MNDIILKTITRLLFPYILLFGFFIMMHGHITPGGGFSGGAIISAGFVLYTLTFGLHAAEAKLPHHVLSKVETAGVLWYILLGLVGTITVGSFLTNGQAGFPLGNAFSILSSGMIALLTIGIGIKVASTMITLFRTLIEDHHD
jgi:multicomponent Na+:H+ antiporter subunit B